MNKLIRNQNAKIGKIIKTEKNFRAYIEMKEKRRALIMGKVGELLKELQENILESGEVEINPPPTD